MLREQKHLRMLPFTADHDDKGLVAGQGPGCETTRTARQALHDELVVLETEDRPATQGELERIDFLAARVGREQHPEITNAHEFAALYSSIASGLDMGDEKSQALATIDLACLVSAYPQYMNES